MAEVVQFYRVGDPYGLFSNFSPHPIYIDRRWPTSEHYFQAQKFLDENARQSIAETAWPKDAARLGRSDGWELRPGWDSIKDDVMRTAIRSKVAQHAAVYEALLSTGDALWSSTPATIDTGPTGATDRARTCSARS